MRDHVEEGWINWFCVWLFIWLFFVALLVVIALTVRSNCHVVEGTGFRLKNGFFVPSFASGLMTAALMVSLAVSAKLLFFSCGGSR